ncbi:TRAP transporter small permease [Nesterenkonia ebinurensis]|uniref:TRAP transporter small permease n=1 Tax=Nesterenkonia ebinurensis TaxID=2608252 RepID=UPI00123DE8DD|nr:TRAP transporter small permease subunit [Nesterenkonia ebinurensis]
MRWLNNIEKYLYRAEKAVVIAAFIAMFFAGIGQVVIRVMEFGSIGTDEIAMVAAALLIFIGAGLGVYTHDHITIELVSLLPANRIRLTAEGISQAALALFGVVFTYYSALYWQGLSRSGETTLQLDIPLTLPVGAMVAGGVLILIHALCRLTRTVAKLLGKEAEDPHTGQAAELISAPGAMS